jgi:hypothetical protein
MIIKKIKKKISLISIGTGNFQYLFPLYNLLKYKINFEIYADASSRKLWLKKNIKTFKLDKKNIKNIIANKIIIMGMVCFKNILFKIIKQSNKNYIIQFFDNITLISKRFYYENNFFFGNEIWTLNKRSYDILKKKTKSKIIKIGHPGFDKKIIKQIKKNSKQRVLIVLQPMKKYNYKFTEYNLLEIVYKFNKNFKNNLEFYVKLHPENSQNTKIKDIKIFNKDIYKNMSSFKYIVGFSSTILTISYLRGVKTARVTFNKENLSDYKPYSFRIPKINSILDMKTFFDSDKKIRVYKKDLFYKNSLDKISKRIFIIN